MAKIIELQVTLFVELSLILVSKSRFLKFGRLLCLILVLVGRSKNNFLNAAYFFLILLFYFSY